MLESITLSSLGKTWILDLDGTIVKHNGYKLDGYDSLLPGAKKFLQTIPEQDMIIFITSRKENIRSITEDFLRKHDIRYDKIIYNAPYGERILMNDKKPSGLLTAVAVNTERDIFCDLDFMVDDSL